MQPNDTLRILLPWSIACALALACAYLLFTRPGVLESIHAYFSQTPAAEIMLADQIREGVAPLPALSPELSEALEESGGFQALVSFTDAGFEPPSLTVQAGDTVRFTNNSSGSLRIRGSAATQTGAADAICDPALLDSCSLLEPQEFWEHTFLEEGTWHYRSESGMHSGIIVVE